MIIRTIIKSIIEDMAWIVLLDNIKSQIFNKSTLSNYEISIKRNNIVVNCTFSLL